MNFERRIQEAKQVALFLDFDGTLAPIVPRPEQAELPPYTRQALEQLATRPKYMLAFVSGRALRDLKARADIPGAIYAGNHGLEIEGPNLNFKVERDPAMQETVSRLRQAIAQIEGAEVEDKDLSASVHFRRVPQMEWPRIEEAVRQAVPPSLQTRSGKMVVEIRPPFAWNKGSAVRWILGQRHLDNACPVYIGDDLTDEDAFAVLPEGITIHVGTAQTSARYRMRDTTEVGHFLERLAHDQ